MSGEKEKIFCDDLEFDIFKPIYFT